MSWFSDAVESVSDAVSSGVSGLGKNLEKNAQTVAQGSALLLQGKWNGAGRALLDANPMTWFMNPDDKNALGSAIGLGGVSQIDRYKNDAKQEALYATANDLQAQRDELMRQASSTVAGLVSARRKGAEASFFGSDAAANGNTLLTFVG